MNDKLPRFLQTKNENLSFIRPALKKAGYELSEASLLQAIHDNKSKQLVHYAVIGLRQHGTKKSISALKQLVHYPTEDVKTTAVVTIGVIAQGEETQYYAALLDDPDFKDKLYPMIVIWEAGTKEALPAVIRYAEKIISKKIKSLSQPMYYQYITEYLKKYPTDKTERLIQELTKLAGTSSSRR